MKYALKLQTTDPTITISSDMAPHMKPGLIPETTREIIFDEDFNVKIEPGWIPMGTETVEFGKHYTQYISPGIFPPTVTCVKFGKFFKQKLSGIIPDNIKIIHIACNTHYIADDLEDIQLEELHYAATQYTHVIPKNTTHLYMFNVLDMHNGLEYKFIIPSSVKKIYISHEAITGGTNINKIMMNYEKEYIYWQPMNKNTPKERYDLTKIENTDIEYIIKNYQCTTINLYEMKINNENMIRQLETEKWNFSQELARLKARHQRESHDFREFLLFILFAVILTIILVCVMRVFAK